VTSRWKATSPFSDHSNVDADRVTAYFQRCFGAKRTVSVALTIVYFRSDDKKESEDQSCSVTATMGAQAGTSNTSTVGRSNFTSMTSTTASSHSLGSITTISETPAGGSQQKKPGAVDMETELSVAVGVLTSHACSEEGLEDATTLLLQLSKASSNIRLHIIQLSFEGTRIFPDNRKDFVGNLVKD